MRTIIAVALLLGVMSCNPVEQPVHSAEVPAGASAQVETAVPTEGPTLPPVTPTSTAGVVSAKNEITDFMVQYIVTNEIEPMIDIILKEQPPMIEKPPEQFIIVASPISDAIGSDYSKLMNALDTAHAEQAWIYQDGKLTAVKDTQKAIDDYRRDFIETAPQMPTIFTWSYDEFGIVSISDDGQTAEVYLAESCGSACGHGILFVLEKTPGGPWGIKDMKGIWGS